MSRSRCALASDNARSLEAICSSNSANSARRTLARSSTARSLISARPSLAAVAPATASRSAVARFSPTTVSTTFNRSTCFWRAARRSLSVLSNRSIGPTSRLKNAIFNIPDDRRINQNQSCANLGGNLDDIAAQLEARVKSRRLDEKSDFRGRPPLDANSGAKRPHGRDLAGLVPSPHQGRRIKIRQCGFRIHAGCRSRETDGYRHGSTRTDHHCYWWFLPPGAEFSGRCRRL